MSTRDKLLEEIYQQFLVYLAEKHPELKDDIQKTKIIIEPELLKPELIPESSFYGKDVKLD